MLSKANGMLLSLAILIGLLSAGTLFTKPTTGTISGTVTDVASDDPIFGVSVIVTGQSKGAKTNDKGEYSISELPPGTYSLTFSMIGYRSETVSITVRANQNTTVDQVLSKDTNTIGKTITVKGTKDIIDKFVTANEEKIKKEANKQQPVTPADQLRQQSAGAGQTYNGQTYIPGGRAGEVGNGTAACAPIKTPPLCFKPCPPNSSTINRQSYDATFFKNYGTNPFVDTDNDNLSTFAVDVDDASFSIAKSYIERGDLPPVDAVRTEEFINHFDYNYPKTGGKTFGVYIEGAPSPFGNPNTYLLRIGIAGQTIPERKRKPANLVFVIDVSGSMAYGNRLETVKDALRDLLNELSPEDQVGIVAYSDDARVVLDPTSIRFRRAMMDAIAELYPTNSTNAEAGIRLGYQMANEIFDPAYTNRIVLCSDGVANVGITDAESLLKEFAGYIKKGITMTTVGVGMENYNDVLLEQLGDKANGHYAYINSPEDARKIFSDNLTGTLQVIARDAKVQVTFDPDFVRSYRLLGYENRDVADEDFRNNKVDGGEVGSGHSVTALYEIKFQRHHEPGQLGEVTVRYKHPDTKEVIEINEPIAEEIFADRFAQTSPSFRLSALAGEFAEILRDSYWAKGSNLEDLRADVIALAGRTEDPQVEELANMVEQACRIQKVRAER